MDTNGLIDNRNAELWNSLRTVHEIQIRKESRADYLVFSKNDKNIIYVPIDNADTASFTHELLHIYLRTRKVFIGGGLSLSIKNSEKLSTIFSDKLIEHIGNCLDHIKMLPEFIRMGYDECEFLSDYSVNKLTNDDVLKVRNHYTKSIFFKKVHNASAINFFIGKYFAANCCLNKSFDYQEQLIELRKIDFELFLILEKLLTNWKNFNYTNTDPFTGGYNSLLHDFIDHLEKWACGKIIK